MRDDVSSDQVWVALAAGDFARAGRALMACDIFLAGVEQKWALAPEEGVTEALSSPDLVLRIERRALGALLDRSLER
jgi:hypothetical protein